MPVQLVSSGVVSSGFSVSAGEFLQVLSGGSVVSATVASGGEILLSSGGLANDVAVSS